MALNNLRFDSHTIDILQAALPHVSPRMQPSVNLILKANDLMSTLRGLNNPEELSTMELDEETQTPEVLLTSIKPVCNTKENEMIDMVLNFIKAGKLFSAYQNYNSDALHTAEVHGNNKRNAPFGMGNLGSFMDFLMSQLTPEQRMTFEAMNMMFNTPPTPSNMESESNTKEQEHRNSESQPVNPQFTRPRQATQNRTTMQST